MVGFWRLHHWWTTKSMCGETMPCHMDLNQEVTKSRLAWSQGLTLRLNSLFFWVSLS